MASDVSAPHLCQHVTYDHLLTQTYHIHNSESFIANEVIKNVAKAKEEDVVVTSDDNTVQISNISHLVMALDDTCPLHLTGKHKWGECSNNPNN